MSKLFELLNKGDFTAAEKLIAAQKVSIEGFDDEVWVATDYGDEGYNKKRTTHYLPIAFKALRFDIIEFLFSHGAKIDNYSYAIGSMIAEMAPGDASTALEFIIKYQSQRLQEISLSKQHNNLLHYLLSTKGIQSHYEHLFNRYDGTPFCFPFSYPHMSSLLDKMEWSVDIINEKNAAGDTPMHAAIKTRHEGMIVWLLASNKVDFTIKDAKGHTVEEWLATIDIDESGHLVEPKVDTSKMIKFAQQQATLFAAKPAMSAQSQSTAGLQAKHY
jgi:ankyrin repeat protein